MGIMQLTRDQIVLRSRIEDFLINHDSHFAALRMPQLMRDLVETDHGPYLPPQGAAGQALRALGWRPIRQRRDPWRLGQRWTWLPSIAPVRVGRPRISVNLVAAPRPWSRTKPWLAAGVSRIAWYRRARELRPDLLNPKHRGRRPSRV